VFFAPGSKFENLLDFKYNFFYTSFMKTAISIPDNLFTNAEKTAKSMGVTRSRLFALAIEAFLAHQNPSQVTEALDRVHAGKREGLDERIALMQKKTWTGETW
jgi:metal-responsive CopG/Arc/MetJ family transcriptional regulator